VRDVEDTTDRLSWGWLATLHNITDMNWMVPAAAANFLHVSTAKLRYWADQGVITCIQHERGSHRRYLASELKLIRRITGNYPTLLALKRHIAMAVEVGFSTEPRQ
jgi:hypothetical protein